MKVLAINDATLKFVCMPRSSGDNDLPDHALDDLEITGTREHAPTVLANNLRGTIRYDAH